MVWSMQYAVEEEEIRSMAWGDKDGGEGESSWEKGKSEISWLFQFWLFLKLADKI